MPITAQSVTLLGVQQYQTGVRSADNRGVLKYLVVLSGRGATNVNIARTASAGGVSIPALGATEAVLSSGLQVLMVDPQPFNGDESGINWYVNVHIGVNPFVGSATLAPWQRKDRCSSGGMVWYKRVLTKAYKSGDTIGAPSGDEIINKAKDPYNPPLMDDLPNSILVISRARRCVDFDVLTAKAAVGYVNDTAFNIDDIAGSISVGQYQARLLDVDFSPDIWLGTAYYNLSIKLELASAVALRTTDLLEQGFNCIESGTKYACWNPLLDESNNVKLDENGSQITVPVSSPVRLAADGSRLADGSASVYTNWQIRPEGDIGDAVT